MGFDFKKYIPLNWKTKMPTDYEWEVHNLNAYKDKKEAFAKGDISYNKLLEN